MSAKINSTYNSGYFIPEHFDQRLVRDDNKRREKRQRDGGEHGPAAMSASSASVGTRQTWMVAYSVVCESCDGLIPRSTKLYVNVTKLREKYLGKVAVFELAMRCTQCKHPIVWRTDPENTNYALVSGARMTAGGLGDLVGDSAGGDVVEISGGRMTLKAEDGGAAVAGAAAGGAAGGAGAATDEQRVERLERHQAAVLAGERVQAAADDTLEKIFFPAELLRAAIAGPAPPPDGDGGGGDGDDAVLSDEARTAVQAEFAALRRAAAAEGGPPSAAAAAAEGLTAQVLDGPDVEAIHAAMCADAVTAAAAAAAGPRPAVHRPNPAAAAPLPQTLRKGRMLAALADYD